MTPLADLGVITIAFDPRWLSGGPLQLVVGWQGIAAAVTVFLALVAAAFAVRRYRLARPRDLAADVPPLRLDDLLFIAVAVVPGAVIGGRLVHALDYPDVYGAGLAPLLDPARGSLSLLGAVVGGTLTAAYIARVLEGGRPDWRRWLEIAAPLLLFLIAGAKLSQFLGGGGQGMPWGGELAVAFLGPGPWQSAAPALPSVPSQLLEAAWAAIGVLVLAIAWRRPSLGTIYLWALAWWLVGRIVIGFTWRDAALVGPLSVEQALALITLVGVAAILGTGIVRRRRADRLDAALAWPERPIDPTELPKAGR